MKRSRSWEKEISRLISGLTISEVASRLGMPYQSARLVIREYGYQPADGRKFCQLNSRKLDPDAADWSQSNAAIGRRFGVSRERVRRVRQSLVNSQFHSGE